MKFVLLAVVPFLILSGCSRTKNRVKKQDQKVQTQKPIEALPAGSSSPVPAPSAPPAAQPEIQPAVTPSPAPSAEVQPAAAPSVATQSPASTKTTSIIPTFQAPPSIPKVTGTKKETATQSETPKTQPAAQADPDHKVEKRGLPADYDKLPVLDFDETRNYLMVMQTILGAERAEQLGETRMPISMKDEDLGAEFVGTFEKFSMTIKNKNEVIAQFKEKTLSVTQATRIDQPPYVMATVCVGTKCEVLFASIFKSENKRITESYPFILKMMGGQYVRVRLMDQERFKEQYAKEGSGSDPNKLPPQMRVLQKYEQNLEKNKAEILKTIRDRMAKDDMIYTARMLPNLKGSSCVPVIVKSSKGYNYKNTCEFSDNKMKTEFEGILPSAKGARSDLKGLGGYIMDAVAIVPNEFYLMTFKRMIFDSPLDSKGTGISGIFVELCQLLDENNQVFSQCGYVPSTVVLETISLEGKMNGPIYAGDKAVVRDGKQVVEPVIYKTRAEVPKQEKETIGF